MNFNFETQGPVTYLVCELAPNEELDPLTGDVREVETVADGEGVCFTRTFETGMSRIYFVKKIIQQLNL